jgi:hypothetical protein
VLLICQISRGLGDLSVPICVCDESPAISGSEARKSSAMISWRPCPIELGLWRPMYVWGPMTAHFFNKQGACSYAWCAYVPTCVSINGSKWYCATLNTNCSMTWVVLFWIVDVAKGARIFLFASHDDMNALCSRVWKTCNFLIYLNFFAKCAQILFGSNYGMKRQDYMGLEHLDRRPQ